MSAARPHGMQVIVVHNCKEVIDEDTLSHVWTTQAKLGRGSRSSLCSSARITATIAHARLIDAQWPRVDEQSPRTAIQARARAIPPTWIMQSSQPAHNHVFHAVWQSTPYGSHVRFNAYV